MRSDGGIETIRKAGKSRFLPTGLPNREACV